MRFALLLGAGLVSGCCLDVCHGEWQGSALTSGTGDITMDAGRAFSAAEFGWMSGRSPASGGPNAADFVFRFSGPGSESPALFCSPDWVSLLQGPVSVASAACVVSVSDSSPSQPLTQGTITATDGLDSSGNGTVTITVDIPSQPFSVAATGDVGLVATSALQGTATFGNVQCGGGLGGNGFW